MIPLRLVVSAALKPDGLQRESISIASGHCCQRPAPWSGLLILLESGTAQQEPDGASGAVQGDGPTQAGKNC